MQYANETLRVLEQQGESLSHASDLMSTQDYMLSRSDRILRGMSSWGGWLSNKLTSDKYEDPTSRAAIEAKERIRRSSLQSGLAAGARSSSEPASYSSGDAATASSQQLPQVPPLYTYSGGSPSLSKAADALSSYRANVLLLLKMSGGGGGAPPDDCAVLMEVCDSLHDCLLASVSDAERDYGFSKSKADEQELDVIKSCARILNSHVREVEYCGLTAKGLVPVQPHHSQSFSSSSSSSSSRAPAPPSSKAAYSSSSSSSTSSSDVRVLLERQDQEIEALSRGLTDLKDMSVAISGALHDQHVVLSNLNTLSTGLDLKQRLVIRRAARLNRRGSTHPGVFAGWCTIRALYRSDVQPNARVRYLSVAPDDTLRVTSISGTDPGAAAVVGRRRDAAVFAMYVRTEVGGTNAVAFVSALSGRYLNQNFWGSFVCTGTSFGTSEEWELMDEGSGVVGYEKPTSSFIGGGSNKRVVTRLLSASAQWGKGAFVRWSPRDDEATNAKREQSTEVSIEEGAIVVCNDADDGTDATVFGVEFIDFVSLGGGDGCDK